MGGSVETRRTRLWCREPHACARFSWLAGDPVAVAEMFLGTPYLWGGNAPSGSTARGWCRRRCWPAGIACPRDSDMQMALGEDAAGAHPKRGDLVFWKGHVAMVVDERRLIHANAHHMAVAYEGIDAAIDRIAAQGDGPVIARRRGSG